MKFRYKFLTLTQIGEVFGTTSHQVGKWLVALGLRTASKRPSRDAFDGGYVDTGPSRGQGYNWVWHAEKTVKALEEAGHKVSISPSSSLIEPPRLRGPFVSRSTPARGYEIVGVDGAVAVTVVGEKNAGFVCRLLNLAHEKGVIDRSFGEGDEQAGGRLAELATAGKATG